MPSSSNVKMRPGENEAEEADVKSCHKFLPENIIDLKVGHWHKTLCCKLMTEITTALQFGQV